MAKESIAFGGGRDVPGRVALRDVFEARYEPLVAQLYGLTGDLREAEQLAQEACVRAAAAERRFRHAPDREAWLRAAAVDARRTRARRSLLRRRSPLRRRRPHRGGSPPETAAPDFDELVCRGARRRARRRTELAAAGYALAAVAGAVTLVDDASPPPPVSAPVPMSAGLPEVEEVGDRIPPGRAGMPSTVPGAPALVSVEVPEGGLWRENASGSGIYSATLRGAARLHLATYIVDGVVRRPCRSSYLPASPGIPAEFVRPGVTPSALGDAIAALPRADVVVAPHTVARWGTTAVHVRVRVQHAGCPNGNLLWTFDTRRGGEFIGNAHARLDFWVVEFNGQAIVVEAEQPWVVTAAERRTLARLLDSVELVDQEPR